MSKLKVSGNASGTGVITLEAPYTNTDRTITLPDSAGTLLMTDGDGSGLSGLSHTPEGTAVLSTGETGATKFLREDGDGTCSWQAAGGADTSLSNLTATGENKVCQAWVNFNGTGTVAIRDSYNVSSITDTAVGQYAVNFTTSLGSSSPATSLVTNWPNWDSVSAINGISASAITAIHTYKTAGTYQDRSLVVAIVFGD